MFNKQAGVELSVTVNNKAIIEYTHNGDTYVEGWDGSNFSLTFRNTSGFRLEVLPTVDGLSTLDGKPPTDSSTGYLIEPHSTLVVDGWRGSLNHVNQFVFGSKGTSYSSGTGQGTKNTGVIGALVYREKPKPVFNVLRGGFILDGLVPSSIPLNKVVLCGSSSDYSDKSLLVASCATSYTTNTSSNNTSRGISGDLGTGYGTKVESNVVEVAFDRDLSVAPVGLVIYYASKANLIARGVIKKQVAEPVAPNPFGNIKVNQKFCAPPLVKTGIRHPYEGYED